MKFYIVMLATCTMACSAFDYRPPPMADGVDVPDAAEAGCQWVEPYACGPEAGRWPDAGADAGTDAPVQKDAAGE